MDDICKICGRDGDYDLCESHWVCHPCGDQVQDLVTALFRDPEVCMLIKQRTDEQYALATTHPGQTTMTAGEATA